MKFTFEIYSDYLDKTDNPIAAAILTLADAMQIDQQAKAELFGHELAVALKDVFDNNVVQVTVS